MAYPALRTTKEDDNVDFQLSTATTLHISSNGSTQARNLLVALGVRRRIFLRHESLSRIKRKKETLNVLLLLEKTRIRHVRRTSKHFPTTKVDFLTITVVLAIMRTITVFRNAPDDFRTESERLAYGSRPYCAFTRYDRQTDRSIRLVGPTSRMKRLHVPIVGPTGRPDPGYVRLVGQTSLTDRSDRL